MKRLILALFLLTLHSHGFAGEPAIDALLETSPIVVVAEPIYENHNPPIGIGSEIVLAKYSIRFRISKILKTDTALKPDDTIFTRLALFLERPNEETFKPQEGKAMILFLRKTSYEENSFENTSIWFGVMDHTQRRERQLERAIKKAATQNR